MDIQEACIHSPLDSTKAQIRVLRLQPRLNPVPDMIVCSLAVADLDHSNCQYEALSYEWGDPKSKELPIVLKGVEVVVRENL
ncbi:uncharacterized protein LY89DRAFT_689087 [Mollisia scopiformis]|uniref:Heterokaryon incompatibility domain-containing protein n=1 Tax=Mollisia scopiformis TaxID=149040 RepID=A0A194WT84_MOLSC|nr:uncharacterized protein LY89DRAFT_689087 [Mollisia scopiformis]KUJ11168.1 hypothetical protein LY89DRAFT_689087 [Mollisia scopiformis]